MTTTSDKNPKPAATANVYLFADCYKVDLGKDCYNVRVVDGKFHVMTKYYSKTLDAKIDAKVAGIVRDAIANGTVLDPVLRVAKTLKPDPTAVVSLFSVDCYEVKIAKVDYFVRFVGGKFFVFYLQTAIRSGVHSQRYDKVHNPRLSAKVEGIVRDAIASGTVVDLNAAN